MSNIFSIRLKDRPSFSYKMSYWQLMHALDEIRSCQELCEMDLTIYCVHHAGSGNKDKYPNGIVGYWTETGFSFHDDWPSKDMPITEAENGT